MALIFPRLARNFIKNGYFPTDQVILARIVGALDIAGDTLRVFGPCCGEGAALHSVKSALISCGASVQALGVVSTPSGRGMPRRCSVSPFTATFMM